MLATPRSTLNRPAASLLTAALLCVASMRAEAQRLPHEFFEYIGAGGADRDGLTLPEPGSVRNGATGGDAWSAPVVFTPQGPVAPSGSGGAFRDGRNAPESVDGPARLDRDTDAEGRLSYAAVFRPSVAPFKRSGARDRVVEDGAGYAIVVSDPTLTPVRIEPPPESERLRFVGRVTVAANAQAPIPVPSVSPQMALHAVRVTPQAEATLWRDGAGNHFLLVSRGGTFQIELQVSAPASYFDGGLPAANRPHAQRPPSRLTPSRLARDARPVLEAAGVTPGMSDVEVVERLLVWFRAFEARPFPSASRTESAYLDIALGRIGVCRHRAQTFVMTASAAGIRSRYVFNDAHAFVEVHFEGAGWRRFDLGGASEGLDIFGDEGERMEADSIARDARGSDAQPLPGTSPEFGGDETTTQESAVDAPAEGGTEQRGDPSATESEVEDGSVQTLGDLFRGAAAEHEAARASAGSGAPEVTEAARASGAERIGTSLSVEPVPSRLYRGDALSLQGALRDARGAPVSGVEVQVYLGPRERGDLEGPVQHIADILVGPDGHFDVALRLPSVVPLGEWALYVSFAGDRRYAPATPP